jgi:AcrR family transcriptional regulator
MGKNRIIEAAVDLFGERGYAATTLRDIAARCDMRAPSIYAHFPNKEALLTAAREAVAREHREHFEAIAERVSGLPPLERLRSLLTAVLDYYSDRPTLVRFHLRTTALMAERGFAELEEDFRAEEDLLEKTIQHAYEQGVADGSMRPGRAEALAALVLCLMDGLFLQLAYYEPAEHRRRFELVWTQVETALAVNGEPR